MSISEAASPDAERLQQFVFRAVDEVGARRHTCPSCEAGRGREAGAAPESCADLGTELPSRRSSAQTKPRICVASLMPEEGLEPPTRGL